MLTLFVGLAVGIFECLDCRIDVIDLQGLFRRIVLVVNLVGADFYRQLFRLEHVLQMSFHYFDEYVNIDKSAVIQHFHGFVLGNDIADFLDLPSGVCNLVDELLSRLLADNRKMYLEHNSLRARARLYLFSL